MSHVALFGTKEFCNNPDSKYCESRTAVFWMPRRTVELQWNRYGMAVRSAISALQKILASEELDKDNDSLLPAIKRGFVSIDGVKDALQKVLEEEGRRQKTLYPRPLFRYNLVSPRDPRNAGAGHVANRAVECRLDACRVHLAESELLVTNPRWAKVLNSVSGVGTYLVVFCRKDGKLTALHPEPSSTELIEVMPWDGWTPEETVTLAKLEMEMVKELLIGVPKGDIRQAASEFMERMEEGDLDGIGKLLAAEVHNSNKNCTEHFLDWGREPRSQFPLKDLLGLLGKRLRKLQARLGYQVR